MTPYVNNNKNILFHFDSLWGVGHLVRSARLLNGLADKFNCHAVSGHQAKSFLRDICTTTYLPQLSYSEDYSSLFSVDGTSVSESLDIRLELCAKSFYQAKPDALIVEMFPYGRHALWQEIMAIFELCQKYSVPIYTSLRDIYIYPSEKNQREQYLDNIIGVLNKFKIKTIIHSDPDFCSVDRAIPVELVDKNINCIFSGYVGRNKLPAPSCVTSEDGKILRTAIGGGKKGVAVYKAALTLLDNAKEFKILYVHCSQGFSLTNDMKKSIRSVSGKEVRFVEFSPEFAFRPLPSSDGWVVSGGYNTVMDVLSTGVPSLIIGLDQEQQTRAKLISSKVTNIGVIDANASPKIMANTWDKIKLQSDGIDLNSPPKLDGSTITADLLEKELSYDSAMHSCLSQ